MKIKNTLNEKSKCKYCDNLIGIFHEGDIISITQDMVGHFITNNICRKCIKDRS